MYHWETLTFLHLLLAAGALLAGLSGLWLWHILRRLECKLDGLFDHCRSCRREVSAQLAGRLEHHLGAADSHEVPPLQGRFSGGIPPAHGLKDFSP
jgi:hypothetical protein